MDPTNRQLSLNLPVPGMRTSIVSLSVAADDVKFVVNNSPANITRAQVCAFLYAHAIPACPIEQLAARGITLSLACSPAAVPGLLSKARLHPAGNQCAASSWWRPTKQR